MRTLASKKKKYFSLQWQEENLVPLLKLTAISYIKNRKAAKDVLLQQCQMTYTKAGVLKIVFV